MVSPNPEYTAIGWFFILLGVSWDARAVAFVCRRCSATIDRIDDPKVARAVRVDG